MIVYVMQVVFCYEFDWFLGVGWQFFCIFLVEILGCQNLLYVEICIELDLVEIVEFIDF